MEYTLKQYLSMSRVIASRYSRSWDEDFVSYIAHFMMQSFYKFNGLGDRESYMYTHGNFAAKRYLYNLKRKKKASQLDFDHPVTEKFNSVDFNDLLDYLQKILTDKEYSVIKMYYIDRMKVKDISQALNCANPKNIYNIISKTLNKIQVYLNVKQNS